MTIASLIPRDLVDLLTEIEGLGFSLTLVGGAPRDFFMQGILSHDLDFEIRNQDAGTLRNFLRSKKINFTELPYQITRVGFLGFDLEFSTPRLERQIVGNKTHHHFEADLNPKLSHKDAFKRRDFTINAIGIELDMKAGTEIVVDPYSGVMDLKEKRLREISDDFFLDSVRFLRLIRFSLKYDLSISESITSKISTFDLSGLSKHHFIEEMMKSKAPGAFINKFNELVLKHKLELPSGFEFWSDLTFDTSAETKDDLLGQSFKQKISSAELVSAFFSMPDKKLKDLKSFYDSFVAVKKLKSNELSEIADKNISELSAPGILKDLKNLEDKKEWKDQFQEKIPVEWSDWESVQVTQAELEKVPAPMRSYLRFHKALQTRFKS